MTTVAMVHSRVRAEEKLLLEAAERLGVRLEPVDDRTLVLDLDGHGLPGDVVLCRSVSTTRGLYVLRAARAVGRPAVNRYDTAAACADKAETSWRLRAAGVPTPETLVAFDTESALAAVERVGYPAVLKPTQGSWARLMARVDDRAQAEQIIEHRQMLPNPVQHVFYVQQYLDKTGRAGGAHRDLRATTRDSSGAPRESLQVHRDLRAFVVGDETVAAVWRNSPHWVTNTARGATTEACPVDDDLNDLCLRAADAVGGGVLAVDLMEGPDGLVVHEVNHTMEFRNSIAPTGVDIPGRILQHAVAEGRR